MLKRKAIIRVLAVLVVVAGLSGSFLIGTKVAGEGAWQGSAKEKAIADIYAIANEKYVELVTDFDATMQQAVGNEITNVVSDKQATIEQALEAYFSQKLDSLKDSEPFQQVKTELDNATETQITYYQQILDGLFGY